MKSMNSVRRCASVVALLGLFCFADAADRARPNIIIILADDLGFSDLGCYGSEIATPNLDRLAASGVRFSQFYTNPRCCPTRAALLTGLYPHQAGIGHMVERMGLPLPDHGIDGYKGELSQRAVTIAEVLRESGYRTAMSGKWHVTPFHESKANWPQQRGFEEFYGTIHGAGSYYDPVSLTRGNEPAKPEGKNFYYTDAISDHAAACVDKFAREPRPFFLYVAYTAPHWPLHALPEDIAKYENKYRSGWDELRVARHRRQIQLGIVDPKWPLSGRDSAVPAWSGVSNQEWEAHRMAVYAAQIDRMDQGIGKILARLRATGAENNTLIMFLADNGGCAEGSAAPPAGRTPPPYVPTHAPDGRPVRRGNIPAIVPGAPDTYATYGRSWANASNTPFRSFKHWVHEGGIATPFIASWPAAIRGGTTTSHVGHVIDVMATCLEISGAIYPREYRGTAIIPVEGKSLLPVFNGKAGERDTELFWEHEGNRAVRQGKWKLVAAHDASWELYDMQSDRTELNNLAATHPDKTKELIGKYALWATRVGVVPWNTYQAKLSEK
jgi:arylsulfatase A-like enzyme